MVLSMGFRRLSLPCLGRIRLLELLNRSPKSSWTRWGAFSPWSIRLLGIVTWLVATLVAVSSARGAIKVLEELEYSAAGGVGLTLDLFLPEASVDPHPCVVVIQGGGFRAQDGQRFRWMAEYLAERGFAAALIAYRGTPEHEYLDTIADTKAAVRYIRRMSGLHGIDPDRIGATGSSAGATLATILAVTGDDPEFEGRGGHPEYSSRIQAAVAYSGVFDFVSRFTVESQIALQPNIETKLVSNGKWVGERFSPESDAWRKASAINHVDRDDPPVLFIHCKDDATVPWLQSQLMGEKMREKGAESAFLYYETGGHGYKGVGEERLAAMVAFFRERL